MSPEVFFESQPFKLDAENVEELKKFRQKVEKAGGLLVEFPNPENIPRQFQIISASFLTPEVAEQLHSELKRCLNETFHTEIDFNFFLPSGEKLDTNKLSQLAKISVENMLEFADLDSDHDPEVEM